MKTKFSISAFAILLFSSFVIFAQDDFKHPHVNSSGHVVDHAGNKMGWVKDGIVYDADGKQIGKIENEDIFDQKGHKIGKLGKDGTLYDHKGEVVYTVQTNSSGKHNIVDAKGKVIGTTDDHYKNQSSAIHYLHKKKTEKGKEK